jgi:hypothetical protein
VSLRESVLQQHLGNPVKEKFDMKKKSIIYTRRPEMIREVDSPVRAFKAIEFRLY